MIKSRVQRILFEIFLLAASVVVVVPFVWMLISSFAPNSEIVKVNGPLFPKMSTFGNYIKVKDFNFLQMFGNSIFISVTLTVLIIYTSAIIGYVLAKYKFRGRKLLFAVILGTMMIPWAVTIIPKYEMMMQFKWLDSYKALIIPAMVSGFGIFMFKQSITSLPDSLLEAARMDGASEWYIFHRIVLPMQKNTIASLAIFQFLWAWEDFLWPFLVITTQTKQLLSVGLRIFSGQYGTDYGGLFAGTTISIIPVIIVYVIFQKQFISGIASGSVKE